jgi:TM2 domain-containing membrane protein YozV
MSTDSSGQWPGGDQLPQQSFGQGQAYEQTQPVPEPAPQAAPGPQAGTGNYGAAPYQPQQFAQPSPYGQPQAYAQPQPYAQPQGLAAGQPYGQPQAGYPVQQVVAPKNPAIGVVLSFFIPGLGTMVNGNVGRGVLILALYVVGFLLAFFFIGIPIMIGVWIWGLIDGYTSAQQWNRQHGIVS